jgi:phosphate:Na+ symporter
MVNRVFGSDVSDLLEDFGGFGLMLVGLWVLFTHVRPLAGSALRDLISGLQGRGLGAHGIGLLAGALVQSPSAVASACASQLAVGRVGRDDALRVFLWSNPGSALLVLLAATDVRALVLLVFGALGASFLFGVDKRETPRHALSALLGAAVMLLGVSIITHDVRGAPDVAEVIDAVAFVAAHPVGGFAAGLALAAALRSTQVVALLTFPLLHAGLTGLEGVAPMIYGASVRWVTGAHSIASLADRASLLLAWSGGRVRVVAIAILCALYALETLAGVPAVLAGVRALAADLAVQAALLFLVAQLAIVAVGEVLGRRLARAADARVGGLSTTGARVGETLYLDPAALSDPASALTLAQAEFDRLVRELPAYLDDIRDEGERAGRAEPLAVQHQGCSVIAGRLDEYLSETLAAHPDMAGMERAFRLRTRVAALRRVQATLHDFVAAVASVLPAARPTQAGAMSEGLHALLHVAIDALAPADDPDAADTLRTLTGDRGVLMDGVRDAILQGLAQGTPAEREAMLDATLHFEKVLWVLPRVADA